MVLTTISQQPRGNVCPNTQNKKSICLESLSDGLGVRNWVVPVTSLLRVWCHNCHNVTVGSIFAVELYFFVIFMSAFSKADILCTGPSADTRRWFLSVLGICNGPLRHRLRSVLWVDRGYVQPGQRAGGRIQWRRRWRDRSVVVKSFSPCRKFFLFTRSVIVVYISSPHTSL